VVGSRIYYDQPAGIPDGMLDSNVILDAGDGNRAIGRCTRNALTGLGLCTFSDGTGRFSGFSACTCVDDRRHQLATGRYLQSRSTRLNVDGRPHRFVDELLGGCWCRVIIISKVKLPE
jgi:hypothetical protein